MATPHTPHSPCRTRSCPVGEHSTLGPRPPPLTRLISSHPRPPSHPGPSEPHTQYDKTPRAPERCKPAGLVSLLRRAGSQRHLLQGRGRPGLRPAGVGFASTFLDTPLHHLQLARVRRGPALQALQRARGCGVGQGRGQGRAGRRRPTQGAPPPYPLLSSSSLGIVAARWDLQELDDADTAGRGVAPALRRAALRPQIL